MSLKYLFASIQLYNVGLTTTKLAILILYRKIFISRRVYIITSVLITLVILYAIETLLTGIFTCYPIQSYWDITMKVLRLQ